MRLVSGRFMTVYRIVCESLYNQSNVRFACPLMSECYLYGHHVWQMTSQWRLQWRWRRSWREVAMFQHGHVTAVHCGWLAGTDGRSRWRHNGALLRWSLATVLLLQCTVFSQVAHTSSPSYHELSAGILLQDSSATSSMPLQKVYFSSLSVS